MAAKKASSSKTTTSKGERTMTKKASTKKAVTTKKASTTKKATPKKKADDGLTFSQRYDKRWEGFVKAHSPEVLRVNNHRKLPDGRELFKLETVDGFQVRCYKDDTYKNFKLVGTFLKSKEAFIAYSQFKEDEYADLPLVGRQVEHGKIIKRLSKPTKKASAAKKPAAKKTTKKAAAPKKPATKRAKK